MTAQRFRSKVDGWLKVTMLVPAVAPLLLVYLVVAGDVSRGQMASVWIAFAVAALGSALVGWMLATTRYDVSGIALTVHCGPLRYVIPLASITRIAASRSILSAPALSMDRLLVQYGRSSQVVISPADRAGFVRAIVAVNRTVVVSGVEY